MSPRREGSTNNNILANNPSQGSDLPKDEAILLAFVERSLRTRWRMIALECLEDVSARSCVCAGECLVEFDHPPQATHGPHDPTSRPL